MIRFFRVFQSVMCVWLQTACARNSAPVDARPRETASARASCALPPAPVMAQPGDRNVLGDDLALCSSAPLTGFFRDGRCSTGEGDGGVHVVCSAVTDAFLAFTKAQGNDLVTPRGSFAGLKAGDRWCLCASRWQEAESAGLAPPVVLEATHEAALKVSSLATLRARAVGH